MEGLVLYMLLCYLSRCGLLTFSFRSVGRLSQAAKLLLDCIATFTCVELCSYKTFMLYALLTNLICLDRNQLRKKLVQDPHVITAVRELPAAQRLLHGIYHCDYQQFFSAVRFHDRCHLP